MTLQELLTKKRDYLLQDWEDILLGEYQGDTIRIFKKQKNQFANPIGYKTRVGLAELYDVVCDESDEEVLTPDLSQFLKVRAVQPISPSQAVAFVFAIKDLVAAECEKEGMDTLYVEFLAFCARVDAAALAVFDIFAQSREQLNKARYDELKTGRNLIVEGSVCSSKLVRDNSKKD
ncbi:MAG: RsbRD N-terminal domain-containing protein [Thermodesulfobacteriota bacterium]